MILITSSDMFNYASFTSADIDVFIDAMEKIPGAKKDTFEFIRQLILSTN